MASSPQRPARYACPCLNVSIRAAQRDPVLPDYYSPDPAYTPVAVDDDGITVTHTRATVRLATAGIPIPGTSRSARFAILVCLFCNLQVYRVPQAIPQDADGHESILFPTEDWIEEDVLKSASGCIDVHKSCLVDQAIADAESSQSFVAPFGLRLSQALPPPPPSPKIDAQRTVSPEPPTEPVQYLDLKPLFLPPPFTPSNPVFVMLATLATQESNQLRSDAEKRILDFIQAETATLQEKERTLKQQVMGFWTTCRTNIQALQNDRVRHPTSSITASTSSTNPRSPSRGRQSGALPSNSLATPANSSSVMIRNFVPVASPTPRSPSQIAGTPKISALSASLVTSGFHHPRERGDQNNAIATAASSSSSASTNSRSSSDSVDSGSSHTVSSNSGSSTLVHQNQPLEPSGSTILRFKRNINDTINTAASYQYFVNVEEEMTRYRKQQEEDKKRAIDRANLGAQEAGPSHHRERPTGVNGENKSKKVGDDEVSSPSTKDTAAVEGGKDKETTPSRGRDKGKRKVTFVVQPAVLTTKDDHKAEAQTPAESQQELIFELEDGNAAGPKPERPRVQDPASTSPSDLPLDDLSLPSQANQSSRSALERSRKQHSQSTARAMETFASLRPMGLPNPASMRSRRSPPGVDISQSVPVSMTRHQSAPRMSSSVLTSAMPTKASPPVAGTGTSTSTIVQEGGTGEKEAQDVSTSTSRLGSESETPVTEESKDIGALVTPAGPPLSERDVEILRLVAANVPSHRGAWTPDGKVWKTFTKKGYKDKSEEVEDEESDESEGEDESDDETHASAMAPGVGRASGADMVVGSLPVPILKKGAKVRVPLSLASYKPEAFVRAPATSSQEGSTEPPAVVPGADSEGVTPLASSATTPTPTSTNPILKSNGVDADHSAHKPMSSSAIHKALYAERDRARAMDPGALDFAEAASDDDDDDDAEDDGNLDETLLAEAGADKSKLHALRILQKRNALPREGMWRSLAS